MLRSTIRPLLHSLVLCLFAHGLAARAPLPPVLGISDTSLNSYDASVITIAADGSLVGRLKNLTREVGRPLPRTTVLLGRRGHLVLAFATTAPDQSWVGVAYFDYSTQKTTVQKFDSLSRIKTLALDERTQELFLAAEPRSSFTAYVYNITARGQFTPLGSLPGFIRQGASTFCPIGRILFVLQETDDPGYNKLVRFDVVQRRVVNVVTLQDRVGPISWDYATTTFYAFARTPQEDAMILATYDLASGNRSSVIVKLGDFDTNGVAAYDRAAIVFYSSFYTQDGKRDPFWVHIRVKTGTASTTPLSSKVGWPIGLTYGD